jgi:AraC family transcriptional regulator of adaptative response/methylated-DNA-[protein]-cysteine methyltransferase
VVPPNTDNSLCPGSPGYLRDILITGDPAAIAGLARQHKRTLSLLTALTYDSDPIVAERAVRAFGPSAQAVANCDPEYVRNHLRRLFWLVSDESGGICPRAPELIGEILAFCPGAFDEFISPLIYLLDIEEEDVSLFRPSILRAIARLAFARPGACAAAVPLVTPLLNDPDPLTRQVASFCLEQLG